MNIAQLKAFVTVVDEGSFSAAARVLGITQPAVTMQLRALEEELGVTLLDRRYRRLDITEPGQELLRHARTVLDEMQAAREGIAGLSGVISGTLLIAASTTPGDYLIPKHLGTFLAQYPNVEVSISIQDSGDVICAVEEGSADVGVTGSKKDARAVFSRFASDELVVIANPALAKDALKMTLKDVAGEPWVMRKLGSGTQVAVNKELKKQGLDPSKLNVVVELGTGEAIVNAVEGGLGVAMVSRYVAEKALAAKTVVQVSLGTPITRTFYAVLPQGTPTAAAQAFHDFLISKDFV